MAYNWIQNSQTTDAVKINANFQEVGSGSRIPSVINTSGVAYTTGVYDLGSSTYKWRALYAQDLVLSGETVASWNRIASADLSVAAQQIQITGLDGETDVEYMVHFRLITSALTTQSIYFRMNADTGTSYGSQYTLFSSTSINTARASGTGMYVGQFTNVTTAADIIYGSMILHVKSGYARTALIQSASPCGQTYVGELYIGAHTWNNTTSTVSSIQFDGTTSTSFGAGSHVDVYARR